MTTSRKCLLYCLSVRRPDLDVFHLSVIYNHIRLYKSINFLLNGDTESNLEVRGSQLSLKIAYGILLSF